MSLAGKSYQELFPGEQHGLRAWSHEEAARRWAQIVRAHRYRTRTMRLRAWAGRVLRRLAVRIEP